MRIVIDMQGAQSHGNRHRGIGRYVLEFAKGMCRQRGEHEVVLALNGVYPDTAILIRDEFKDLLSPEQICVWQAPGPLHHLRDDEDGRRKIAEDVRFAFLNSLSPSVVINGAVFESISEDSVTTVQSKDEGASYITAAILHDLIPLILKEEYLDPNEVVKTWYLRHLEELKKCDLFLANSGSTRQEAIDYLHWPSDRAVNISAAVSSGFFPAIVPSKDEHVLREKFGLTKPFIMYTGGMDRRKNVEGLVQAFGLLPDSLRQSHQLAIVCKLAPSQIEELGRLAKLAKLPQDAVVLTGFVSDAELISLYRLCKIFVFPSWHEGFGLPLLEAMNCGKAVLCGDKSAMPEVVGTSDAFFNAKDPQSIALKMEEVLSDDAFRERLEAHSLEYSKNFSWDISAKRAIAAIEDRLRAVNQSSCNAHGVHTSKRSAFLEGIVERVQMSTPKPSHQEYWVQLASCLDRTFAPDHSSLKRIFVDVTELARRDARTGIQRVVRSILVNWLNGHHEDYEFHLIRADESGIGYLRANQFSRFFMGQDASAESDVPVDFYPGDTFLGLDLQPVDVPARAGYFHTLRAWGVTTKFVVYDLLPVLHPDYFPVGSDSGHAKWLDVVIASNDAICISRSVAEELRNYIANLKNSPATVPAIDWFHLGADIESSSPTKGISPDGELVLRNLALRPTFLIVGTLEPRKGHTQVLDAFEELWREGVDANLVFVGREGWRVEALTERLRQSPELGSRLFWLDGVSDEYLEAVYNASTCLIAASFGEGFGLPLIEAAQHGVPIIARDIPVFREVAGDHALYFSDESENNLIDSIQRWLSLYERQQHPDIKGMTWSTWAQSAKQLSNLI